MFRKKNVGAGFGFPLASLACLIASTAAAAQTASGRLEEVLVTASKRTQTMHEVPASVNVMSGAALDNVNASNFQDFASYVPSLSSLSSGTGQNQVVLRGITTGGQSSPTVGIYVDETPIGSSTSFAFGSTALDFNTFDLERLEVLSGPQGTLYGASTLGGLVKYVTRAPDLTKLEALLQADVSHTQHGESGESGRIAVNLPLLQDRFAVRIDGIAENDPGYIDNPRRGVDDVDASTTRGGRISMLGDITDNLSLRLTAIKQKIERDGKSQVDRDPETQERVVGKYQQLTVIEEPFSQDFELYSGVVNWDIGWADFTSASSWQEFESDSVLDSTEIFSTILGTGGAFQFQSVNIGRTEKFTQELRLTSPASKRFEWQLGLFYTEEDSDNITRLLNASSADGTLNGAPLFIGHIPTKYREVAGFSDVTVYLSEKADITLGLRYSRNDQDYTQRNRGLFNNPVNPSLLSVREADSSENVTTYLVNPRYRLNADVMLYARVASGFRPGGPNLITYDAQGRPLGDPTFESDTLWSYEAGVKGIFLDGRATLDFDVFYIDWSDIQLTATIAGLNQLQNGGEAQVQGAELIGSFEIHEGFKVGGSMSFNDAELTQDVPGLDAHDGDRLPLSPRFSTSLTADYHFPVGRNLTGSVGASYRYVGQRNAGFDDSAVRPQYDLESYDLVDLRAALETEKFAIGLFVKNLFDKVGEVSADLSAVAGNPNAPARVTLTQPRTIGAELTLHFQ